jgi:hypothetical protein
MQSKFLFAVELQGMLQCDRPVDPWWATKLLLECSEM